MSKNRLADQLLSLYKAMLINQYRKDFEAVSDKYEKLLIVMKREGRLMEPETRQAWTEASSHFEKHHSRVDDPISVWEERAQFMKKASYRLKSWIEHEIKSLYRVYHHTEHLFDWEHRAMALEWFEDYYKQLIGEGASPKK